MKGKSLGRGLEDISHVFLSSEEQPTATDGTPGPEKGGARTEARAHPALPHAIGVAGSEDSRIGIFVLCNLAIEMARQGSRILVVDEDAGQPNVARFMGHVETPGGEDSGLHTGPMGVRLMHRTAFMNALASEGFLNRDTSREAWPEAYRQFDYLLFSLPHQRLRELGPLVKRISLCIAMAPEDSAGMLETYTTLKDFHRRSPEADLGMIVYTGAGESAAREAFHRMARNVRRFLQRELISYAYIPKGQEIRASLDETAPLVLKWPASVIRKHLFSICGLVLGDYAAKGLESNQP